MKPRTLSLALALALLASSQLTSAVAHPQSNKVPVTEITGSQSASGASFGYVALWGDTAVVGAYGEPHPPSGVTSAGAAYVFERTPGSPYTWTEVTRLISGSPQQTGWFGTSVDIEGDTIAVGAPAESHSGTFNSGAVYVFDRDQGGVDAWGQSAVIVDGSPTAGDFGRAVAISGDTIAVGAPFKDIPSLGDSAGAVFLHVRDLGGPGAWGLEAMVTASDGNTNDWLGRAVALDAGHLVAGTGVIAGAAYVFERDLGGPGNWGEASKLLPAAPGGGQFGAAVAVRGDVAVVGAWGDNPSGQGSAYVFERDLGGPGKWGESDKLVADDATPDAKFGYSVALDGDRLAIGAVSATVGGVETGRAYVFERAPGTLGPFAPKLHLDPADGGENDGFGYGVDVHGGTALVGAVNGSPGNTPQLGEIEALARDPLTGDLWAVDDADLILLDPVTAAGTRIGPLGWDDVVGLAFDPGTGTLYGSRRDADVLVRVDTSTGAVTTIGPLGFGWVNALAFDPAADVLYGSDITSDELLVIDTVTGVASAVGALGFNEVAGLTFDTSSGTLFGTDSTTDKLLVIDTATGAATAVGNLGIIGSVNGLADGDVAAPLFAVKDFHRELLDVDTTTGAASTIGNYGYNQGNAPGSAYLFDLSEPGEAYCTAGTSAAGCKAALSAAGAPSASFTSGFVLFAEDAEGARPGMFFYGQNGRQAAPWGNGTSYQCIATPVRRGGLMTAGGTPGSCDGVLSQDLNARWCSTCPKPAHSPTPGLKLQAQLWYRDPLSTSNRTTSLSNALEVDVSP